MSVYLAGVWHAGMLLWLLPQGPGPAPHNHGLGLQFLGTTP